MFRRNKDTGSANSVTSKEDAGEISAPPLKPFSKMGSHTPQKPSSATALRPSVTRPTLGIQGGPRRMESSRNTHTDNSKLIVGREIHIKGEIASCERLVVEGKVEAVLVGAHSIEVTRTGNFMGDAQVNLADISGSFDGTLVVNDKLIIRSSGRASGSIRYGQIVIESGGEILGDMQTITPEQDVNEAPASLKQKNKRSK